jgi:glutaredoxin 3
MYTQAFCAYCAAARSLLDKKQVPYEELDVTLNAKLRREMVDRSGKKTVPQIFIDDKHIGGYDDLSALDRAGKLDELLELPE